MSKVRFIMLEAEMPEGDLAQITTAIQNALRPAQVNGPRLTRNSTQVIGQSEVGDEDVIDAGDYEEAEDEVGAAPSAASKPRKPAKPAKRKVLPIDLDSEVSFATYAEKYPPKTETDRHLVAVAYFQEHREDTEGVSADHVYTAFRKVGWSTATKDFAYPLRYLKKEQLIDSGPSRGTYVVNHIGLDKVHKLAEG